ncbi:MAG: PEGA domain-containing protein [Acidobacteriota bacterium]|nr:PEGA domain-containing protein [Acidobacteriota bacterium]
MFSLTEFWSRSKSPAPVPAADSLDAFFAENGPPAPEQQAGPTFSRAWLYVASIGLVVLIGATAGGVYLLKKGEPVSAAPSAAVTIESDPVGAEVSSAGVAKGVTPLTLSVAPGEHTFEVVHAERRKQVRVNARAETAVVHHVQFDLPGEGATGALPKGSSPQSVATSGVRAPSVRATSASNSSARPAGPAAGWITITSPIPLTVMEGGQVIGSTASAKIMLPAGKRDLRFSNDSLGFSAGRSVQVSAGKTATIAVSVPKAAININAVPWAEVWIDGVRVGETPIGNYMVPLGSHDIVFRHPTLGERRQTATVSKTAPARVSVDMRKQ